MLEKTKWLRYAPNLLIEWKQAKDEGRDVEEYKEICEIISRKADQSDCTALAESVLDQLLQAKALPDFPFVEPSDYEGILSARPKKRHSFQFSLSEEQLADKITGAWIGRISGCLLGKPVEGLYSERLYPLLKLTNNYPIRKYIVKSEFNDEANQLLSPDYLDRCWADAIGGIAPVDDDTNYTVLSLKLVEKYGPDFRPNDVLEAWLLWVPMLATSTAERTAYRNAAMGKLAPETATYQNPCREWIGAQIRGDFLGFINPANPEKAAEMAWRDASVSHVKNGIYGEMFISAMIAAASVCGDVMKVIEAGLDEIPSNCRLRKGIEQVIAMYGNGSAEDDVIGYVHSHYVEHESHGWCHTVPNAMIVAMALLYGNGDFGKSICLAVQAAFDTDCNGATVGSVVGIMNGAKSIPREWIEPHQKTLSTSIVGYPVVTVEELTKKTLLLCNGK